MKHLMNISLLLVLALALGACSNKDKEAAQQAEQEVKNLNDFLDIVAVSMDSLTAQEHAIFYTKEGQRLSNRQQIMQNLETFKQTVDRQHERIAELEAELQKRAADDAQAQKLQAIITTLKRQLAEKDQLIAKLQDELKKKDADIASLSEEVTTLNTQVGDLNTQVGDLNEHVTTLNNQVEQLDADNQAKDTKIAQQAERVTELTTAYVSVGTKQELVKAGLLTGSGLAKKKFNPNNVKTEGMQTVSTTEKVSIDIPGSKPEVMTQHPAGSYTLTQNKLTVTNPEKFWSVSHVLVIKHK